MKVHHEVAPSQHEIDLRYTDALTMAAFNPYLALAAMLAAGLAGIARFPPAARRGHKPHLRDERGRTSGGRGSDRCPRTSSRRSIWPKGSKVFRDALGDHVYEFLMHNKRAEWDAPKSYVTPHELERYLPIL